MNQRSRNKYGGGAQTNKNGLDFEKIHKLDVVIQRLGFDLVQVEQVKNATANVLFKISKDGDLIGYYGTKSKIYKALQLWFPKKITNEYVKKVLSKKIYPDAFLINLTQNLLVIIEIKWQVTEGSVDEKIQTAPYKLAMFEKLLRNLPVVVVYQYLLSAWFGQPKYQNVHEYYAQKHPDQVHLWIDKTSDLEQTIGKFLTIPIKRLVEEN